MIKRIGLLLCALWASLALCQNPLSGLQIGQEIPSNVEDMYRRGLTFLAVSQTEQGNWSDTYGAQPGVVGITVLAFLASGEDPNYGPYREVLQKAAAYILSQQNEQTGYIGNSMYNHGFAALALAELYGHLHEPNVGPGLKRAIELILESQEQNPMGAWRYTPISKDADTTLSGAQMVALFAAKNAGFPIPAKAFERGAAYYASMSGGDGGVGYSGGSTSGNTVRTAISSLVFSLMNDYDSDVSKQNFRYLRNNLNENSSSYPYYQFYYLAQALFQGDMSEWHLWNQKMIRVFEGTQTQNGSWNGPRGPTFSTASSLLAMALNYRLMPIYER